MDPERVAALRAQPGVAPGAVERGLELIYAPPSAEDWRSFLDRALAGLGALLLLAGVFFFFAYNWRDLSRLARLGLLQGLIAVLFLAGRRESLAGRVCLAAASTLIGALLAVYGQAYQTGADSYLLFTTWALLAIPWVAAAGLSPLWLGWTLLGNLSLGLYLGQEQGVSLEEPALTLILAGCNAVFWVVGERARRGWLVAALGTLAVGCLTWASVGQLISGVLPLAALVALPLVVLWYRPRHQLFFLALAAGSVITLLTAAFIKAFEQMADNPAFWLLLAVILLAQLALAASWLRFEARR
ncbi:DUF2157 domain-containing protein [bacterium CPR1]|nr:DUF2157 domain-containing protein [bacterium CPR1]